MSAFKATENQSKGGAGLSGVRVDPGERAAAGLQGQLCPEPAGPVSGAALAWAHRTSSQTTHPRAARFQRLGLPSLHPGSSVLI